MPFAPVKSDPWKKGIRWKRERKRPHIWPDKIWKEIVECFLIPSCLDGPIIQVGDWRRSRRISR